MKVLWRVVSGSYLIAVGVAFGVRGVIALQDPDFWEPVTDLDYAAVWTHSLAILLAAPALVILVRQAEAGPVATTVAWIMAVGGVLSAIANAIEDGFDQEAFGVLYVVGSVPFFFGQIVLAILLGTGKRPAFALVPGLTFFGAITYDGGGGILIGTTWAVFGILVLIERATPPPMAGRATAGPQDAR